MRRSGTSVAVLLLPAILACGGAGGGRGATAGATSEGTGTGGTTGAPEVFGPETEVRLRIDDTVPPPLVLEMNRGEVADLFQDAAAQITLLDLDTTALLENQLAQIVTACGTDWMNDKPDPVYDCSLTPLGQTFEGWDGTWKTSPEFSLVRILTMTPANADVSGTSVEGLQELADLLGIGGGYSQILSEALGIPRTEPIVDAGALVPVLQADFLGTHPNVTDGTKLPITLEDALTDLATLGERLGPAGTHPGVLDPAFPVSGQVLGPDFRMTVRAQSNLRIVEGVEMGRGKDYLVVVADVVGPTYDDELEFDFEDPEAFQVEGLVPDPTVDLRFSVQEWDTFVPSCTGEPCKANLPGSPVGASSVWNRDGFLLERIVVSGAHQKYGGRTFYAEYGLGVLATVSIGQDGDPPGWTRFWTLLNLGSPPEDQYIWEMIGEVAQVRMHDNGFTTLPEGAADVAFTMFDVPVGLSADAAVAAMRPVLQEQSGEISDLLLGDYKKNNGLVDFYLRRGDDGRPYLFFVAPEDLAPEVPYTYQAPGFYGARDLDPATKLSAKQMDGVGDVVHEKLAIPPEETVVYAEGRDGAVYRVRVVPAADPSEVVVYVAAPR